MLIVPDRDRRFGCLIRPNNEPVSFAGPPGAETAFPVRVDKHGLVTLTYALDRNYHLCLHAEPGSKPALRFTRAAPDKGARFTLHPREAETLPAPIRTIAARIAAAIEHPPRWQPLREHLRAGRLDAETLRPLLTRLPNDEWQHLAVALLADPDLENALFAPLAHDPWFGQRLPHLLAWARRRTPTASGAPVPCAETRDLPGQNGTTAHRLSPGLVLAASIRRAVQPRHLACVLGSARNEGPYFLEWVAHYRAIGFDRAFLYTNDNTDGSDALLKLLAEAGEITWLRNETGPGTRPQFKAYSHALSILPEVLDYRWTLIADLDELMGFDTTQFATLAEYLGWHEAGDADAIALPWLLHVARPGAGWQDAPCTKRFPMREVTVNHHIKTMFRTNLFWSANAHHPEAALGPPTQFHAEHGGSHIHKAPEHNPALAADPRAHTAWIAHFILRSAPEALMKAVRGKGDESTQTQAANLAETARRFLSLSSSGRELVHDGRTARCGARADAELARLRAIQGVSAAESAIKRRFVSAMDSACLKLMRQPPEAAEPPAVAAFRALLARQRHDSLFAVHN